MRECPRRSWMVTRSALHATAALPWCAEGDDRIPSCPLHARSVTSSSEWPGLSCDSPRTVLFPRGRAALPLRGPHFEIIQKRLVGRIRSFYNYLINEEKLDMSHPVKRGYFLRLARPLPRYIRDKVLTQ